MKKKIVLILLGVCLVIAYQAWALAESPDVAEAPEETVELTERQYILLQAYGLTEEEIADITMEEIKDVLENGIIVDFSKLEERKHTPEVETEKEEPVVITSTLEFPQTYNGYTTRRIDYEVKEDYYLVFVDWLDENKLLTILSGPRPENSALSPHEIYVINLLDSSKSLIHMGEHDGGYELRSISEEQFGLQCQDSYLIFDLDTFELMKTIPLPSEIGQSNISYDAKEIAYFDEYINEDEYDEFYGVQGQSYRRLLVTNLEDDSTKVLEDVAVSYAMRGEAIWSAKNQLLKIRGFDGVRVIVDDFRNDLHKVYELDIYAHEYLYKYWFPDGERLLVHNPLMMYGKGEADQLYIVDTTNSDMEIHELEERMQIKDLYENLILYEYDAPQEQSLCAVYDCTTEKKTDITNLFRDIGNAHFSPSGKSVAVTGVLMNTRNVPRSLYIITRDRDTDTYQ